MLCLPLMPASDDADVRNSQLNVATVRIVMLSLGRGLPGEGPPADTAGTAATDPTAIIPHSAREWRQRQQEGCLVLGRALNELSQCHDVDDID